MDLRQRQKLRKMQKRRKRRKIIALLVLLLLIIFGVRSCIAGISSDKKEEVPKDEVQTELVLENEPKNVTPETQGYVDSMALDYKLLQLFVVEADSLTGVEGSTIYGEKTAQAITDTPVGGIIYRERNIETKTQLGALLDNTQKQYKNENGFPVFLIAEEEGGELSPIADRLGGDVGNMSQFADDYNGAFWAGEEMGKYMKALGFNMTLAPSLAVDDSERSFSNDAEEVGSLAAEFAGGLKKNGIVPVFKSFPGDSSALSLDELKNEDFVPFQVASNNGADVIMVSGDIAPQSVGQMPCYSSSAIVTDSLRNEIGFDGIIMTEPLQSDEDAVSAILAGCDMLLMPKDLENAVGLLKKAIENGEITEERIDNSIKRIIRVKLGL